MRTLLILLLFSAPAFAKPLVIASFSILGDMVHVIGQDKIEVKSLVGANQDSHVYEPRPKDAKELGRADLIVMNGLGFEGWLERLIESSGFHGQKCIATTGIQPLQRTVRGKVYLDPHAWLSLHDAQVYVDNIVEALSDLIPEEAPFFKSRGEVYKQALVNLQEQIEAQLKSVSLSGRKVITNHAAFSYLGRDFGITFYSAQGLSTEAEPSAKAVASLIRQIKKEGIKAIFVENISNPKLMKEIANETSTKIGGILYSDALSSPGTQADTYLKMMTFNLSSLVNALRNR